MHVLLLVLTQKWIYLHSVIPVCDDVDEWCRVSLHMSWHKCSAPSLSNTRYVTEQLKVSLANLFSTWWDLNISQTCTYISNPFAKVIRLEENCQTLLINLPNTGRDRDLYEPRTATERIITDLFSAQECSFRRLFASRNCRIECQDHYTTCVRRIQDIIFRESQYLQEFPFPVALSASLLSQWHSFIEMSKPFSLRSIFEFRWSIKATRGEWAKSTDRFDRVCLSRVHNRDYWFSRY